MRQPNLSGWCAFFGLLLMIGVDLRPGSATGKEERTDGPGALPGVRCAARAGTALEILGSGGPMHREARGSAAYLLWHRGRPAAVVDMGGDTAMALARAGVDAGEIDTLLISHFHPDHVSGLPDFLWGESCRIEIGRSRLSVRPARIRFQRSRRFSRDSSASRARSRS